MAMGQVGLVDLAPVVPVNMGRVLQAPVGPVDTERVLLAPVVPVDMAPVVTAVVILDPGALPNQPSKAPLNWLARACRRLVNSQQVAALAGRATLL